MQIPSIGRVLHYVLTDADCAAIMRRRTNGSSIAERMKAEPPQWPAGAQAHIGNPVSAGQHIPLIVTAVWPGEFGEGTYGINGQALLDGNDCLWITSARLEADDVPGFGSGCCHWPERV